MEKEELAYLLALYSVEYIGPKRLKLLLDNFGDPKKAWEGSREELAEIKLPKKALEALFGKRGQFDPQAYLDSISSQGIRVLTFQDEEYPKLLKRVKNPPPILFVKGRFLSSDQRALAVIGTRTPSFYGVQVTEILVEELVGFGVTIVSGLARGIDSLAHKVALKKGGRTIAVLGSGLDICYPPENKSLLEEISKNGVVVSQFSPKTKLHPGLFPARNRLISGLSLGVLVTEAAHKSGTKITAEFAKKQNRPVFAVPGPITSSVSRGTNELIQMGAKLVYSVQDILEEPGIEVGGLRRGFDGEQFGPELTAEGLSRTAQSSRRKLEVRKKEIKPESAEEEILLSLLGPTPIHIDELVRKSDLSISIVGSTLSLMEIKGKVKNVGNKMYLSLS